MSNVPATPATLSGESASSRCVARGKYSSIVRPLNHVAPSPGRRITRATDVLRFPVPRYCAIWLTCSPSSSLGVERLRRLRRVGVLRSRVDLQLRQLPGGEAVL